MNEVTVPNRTLWQRVVTLVGIGFLGVLALLLQPLPESLLRQRPELTEVPLWSLKLLGMLNPTILLVAAVLLGALVAHRVGLRSVLAGTAHASGSAHAWGLAARWGLMTGVAVVGLDVVLAPFLGDPWEHFLRQASRPEPQSLLVGILYGGITEEILMRWGLMSVSAWAIWALGGQRHTVPALVIAGVLAALIFGATHLPAVASQVELNPMIIGRTVAVNALAALVYGWVFWRHHLEAAMLCHACSHVAMAALWTLL